MIIVGIEEDLERSRDFITKKRTIHPEQDPIHEQL